MSVELLYPLNTKLIGCPAVVADCENPVWREVAVPASLVLLTRQDHEGWETPARRVDTLNRGNPVLMAWLYSDCSACSMSGRDADVRIEQPVSDLLISFASSAYGEHVGCFKVSEALQVELRGEVVERHVEATGLA
jgi:hypothetical protein